MSKMHCITNGATFFIATIVATVAPPLTSMAQAADVGGFLGGAGAEPVWPPLTEGEPSPGKFVRQQSPEFRGSGVYHGLYLPTNWQPGHSYPVIVEYAPNRWEALTGKVDDCRLGFYLSGGRDFIWLVLPYVDPVKKENVVWWWGSEDATIEYCLTNLRRTCEQYGGDPNAVLFTGFSRGAIAAGYLTLRNDAIADIWLGFLPHSHIDGGRFTPDGARERLARTPGRPTFITYGSDDDGKNESPKGARILRELGFPVVERELAGLRHTDRFLETDSPIRREMREWIADVLKRRPGTWTVRGRVVDRSGRGIPGVRVQCGNWHWSLTDAEGRYAIPSLVSGRRPLVATNAGWQFAPFPGEVTVEGNDVTVEPLTGEPLGTSDTALPSRRPGEKISVKEHLGRAWPNELIHYDSAFAPGEVRPTDIHMVDGKGHGVPAQLSAVTKHPDGSIQNAQVWFLVSLQPGEVTQFQLQPGKSATSNELNVSRVGDRVEINNGLVGARFHLGEKSFEVPIAAHELPAFLAAVQLRGGAWTGRGWFETPKKCRSYKVALVESGPVFARIAFEYRFDGFRGEGRDIYRGTAQITAGQEIIYLTEEFSLGDPKVYREPQFASEAEELLWDWWKWRPHEATDNFCFSFTVGGAFQPTHARCIEHNVTTPTKGQNMGLDRGENEYPLPFDVDRLEFTLNALSRLQPDQAVLYTLFRRDQADSDIVSLLPCRPGQWRNPDLIPHDPAQIKQHTDTSDLRVYSTAQRDVLVRAPLHLGRREWAIAVLKNPGVVTEARDFTPLCRLSAKHGGFSLDKVKDWALAWPDTHVYAGTPPDRDSKVGKEYREVSDLLGRFVREALDFPRGGERTSINSFPNNCATFIGRARALLESGQLTAEQGRLLRARAAFLTCLLWDDDYFPPRRNGYGGGSANMPVSVARGRMDAAAALPDHPMAKTWLTTSAKVMGYVINANFGDDGAPQSNPHYMGLLTDAAVSTARLLKERGAIQDEKAAFPHFHKAAHFLVDMLTPKDIRLGQRLVPPVGDGYWEKHQNALTVAPVFKDSDPELAANLLWAGQEGGLGDASLPGVTARAPGLKSVAYPGWGAFLRQGFGTAFESYLGIRFGDFTLDHTHNDAGSINWYARGVPLALDFATMYTPHTPGAWLHTTLTYDHHEHPSPVKCPGRGHADCFYTGKSWYDHEFEPHSVLEPIPDRASTEFTEVHGKITFFASQPAVDYVRGEANRRWFERKPYFWRHEGSPSPWGQFSEWNNTELGHPFRWVRQFAFVKDEKPDGPCYLVIADDLTGNQELEPAFNFWCLASEVKEVAPRHLRFTGQHGLDCEMFTLAPATGRIQLGEWGHSQGFLVGDPGMEENQKLARVYGPRGGQAFLAVLYPRKANEPEPKVESLANGKLVRLTLPDQTHWILLSTEPAAVSDEAVKLRGTAAVVKRWNDGRALVTLLAAGQAEYGDVKLNTDAPISRAGRMP